MNTFLLILLIAFIITLLTAYVYFRNQSSRSDYNLGSYRLFLDDERYPENVAKFAHPSYRDVFNNNEWVIVKNYWSFIACIKNRGIPKHISFDHDLGTKIEEDGETIEIDGAYCAKWLCNYLAERDLPLPFCTIHSQNTVGAKRIKDELDDHINEYGKSY